MSDQDDIVEKTQAALDQSMTRRRFVERVAAATGAATGLNQLVNRGTAYANESVLAIPSNAGEVEQALEAGQIPLISWEGPITPSDLAYLNVKNIIVSPTASELSIKDEFTAQQTASVMQQIKDSPGLPNGKTTNIYARINLGQVKKDEDYIDLDLTLPGVIHDADDNLFINPIGDENKATWAEWKRINKAAVLNAVRAGYSGVYFDGMAKAIEFLPEATGIKADQLARAYARFIVSTVTEARELAAQQGQEFMILACDGVPFNIDIEGYKDSVNTIVAKTARTADGNPQTVINGQPPERYENIVEAVNHGLTLYLIDEDGSLDSENANIELFKAAKQFTRKDNIPNIVVFPSIAPKNTEFRPTLSVNRAAVDGALAVAQGFSRQA